MAVAFDGETVTTAAYSGASSATFSNHTTAGSDRLAVLCAAYIDETNFHYSTCTYGGSAMTESKDTYDATNKNRAGIFTYVAPATGATNCVLNWGSAAYGYAGVLSFNGVDQTTPVSNTSGATGTGTAVSTTCTTSSGEIVVDCVKSWCNSTGAPTVGADQTSRFSGQDGSYYERGCGSTQDGASGGVMSWTLATSTGANWAISAASLKAAASGASVTPAAGSLTLTGVAPTVKTTRNISPAAGALTITGVAPAVAVSTADISVSVDAGTLTLTGVAPTITANFGVSPAAGTLAITGVAPTLKTAQTVSVAAGELTLTGYAPTVKQGVSISPAAGALAITGIAPSVTEQIKVTPSAGALTITGVAPSVFVAAPGTFAPGYATLTLTGVAPTVTQQEKLSVPAGSLTITGLAPSVSVGTSISVGAGALAITGVAPTVTTNHNIVVGAAELTLAGYAPVVASPLNFLIEPAQIILTGYAPTVAGGTAPEVEAGGGGAGWPIWEEDRPRVKSTVELTREILDEVDEEMREAVGGEPLEEVLARPVDAARFARTMTPRPSRDEADDDDDLLLLSH